jgi:hypothetical protein
MFANYENESLVILVSSVTVHDMDMYALVSTQGAGVQCLVGGFRQPIFNGCRICRSKCRFIGLAYCLWSVVLFLELQRP